MIMNARILILPFLLGFVLLIAAPATAQQASALIVYFYRDGQATPVPRPGTLSGDPQIDATALLSALLAGPTPDERASGLTSPLPPDAELVTVAVSGDEVTANLRLPLAFLHHDLDPYLSDTIVEQIVKTLHPLGLHHVHVHAEDETGAFVPMSDFLPRLPAIIPTVPSNDDAAPDRPGPVPGHVGQPPTFGQGQPQGALSGKTVWLSAGHGWYWSDTLNRWTTQRGNNHGLVEDFSNAEAVNYYLARYLWNAGAEVWLVRDRAMTEHEIIVDNDDGEPAYTETGSWLTSSSPGYGGGTYRWASTFDALSATATWTPDLPDSDWYAVWAWYRHGTNRPTDSRYEIHHAGGVTTVSTSQEVHGQTWRYLGEYYFESGMVGHVTLVNESDDPGQAVIADAIRFGGGVGNIAEPGGASGKPRWEEAAKYWARYQGAPPEICSQDATSRPLYAEWETAKGYPGEANDAVYVSWHTNAGGGTGTVSYIHDTEPTAGSAELQSWIHAELIHDLRAAWNPDWVNRGRKSANFSEVRELSTIPGVLLEIAFHDTEDPGDADDLREPVFRQIAARAVFQGIVKYFADREDTPVRLLPEPPTRLVARNTAPGQVTLTWTPSSYGDEVAGDAPTSYNVYQSADGRAFADGIEVSDPALTLTGLPSGTLRFFRVTALNEGGESFPTPVVAVRTLARETAPAFLLVDGFDRLDQTAMIPQWESPYLGTDQRMFLERMNRYDYAVEHGRALSACGLAFDGVVNEAVELGDVDLDDYPAVGWFVGEDSVADASLSDAERVLLAAYLGRGGRLFISGAEIGYDLVEGGRDPSFYHDYLGAEYLGDDAGTYDFAGVTGGLFDGLAGSFDDGSGGAYDVGYPDRLAAAPGSTVALTYTGGTADGAAVVYDGDFRVVHFGFPLETVTDPAARTALVCATASYLLPEDEPPEQLCSPRLINPGFEGGRGQTAWQTSAPGGDPILVYRDDLPAYVTPYGGDWLAQFSGHTPGITVTAILTQVVALPSGEPTSTLTLAWFVHTDPVAPSVNDTLSIDVYDLGGALQVNLSTITNHSPTDAWQTESLDVGAFAGEAVQLSLRAITSATTFFVDDVSLTTCGPPGPGEVRALWVDAYHDGAKSPKQIDELIQTAQAGSFNALVVQVRRRGDTYYPSDLDPWAPDSDPNFDALAYLIEQAHAAGIEVHAWATTLAIWGGDAPPAALDHAFNLHGPGATGRDYWLALSYSGGDRTGDKVYYLDPGHPDAADYTVAIYAELAARYDLDGLHLDRVRYPWQNWGYNPTALSRFQAQTGRDELPEPDDREWLQWRRDQVTALVRKMYLTATAINPQLRVSAALSASGGPPSDSYPWETRTPYTHQLQDWRSWLEEGILDLGLPMTYRDEDIYAGQFDGWIAWQKDHQYSRGAVVGTGLYLNAVEDSMAQWLRVRQPSNLGNWALGMCGYSYATPSDEAALRRTFANAAVTEVFAQPAAAPGIAWKHTPTLGHLMGTLTQALPCRNLDGYPLALTGPQDRTLFTDGSGWFGTADLVPGEYLLSVDVLTPSTTISLPVTVAAGAVTAQEVTLPACQSWGVYLPLVLKQASP
jgi:uncharacterized lipoprotein YddW (UPF0748 family)